MRILSLFICLFSFTNLMAQRGGNILSMLDSLHYTDELPKELLSSKTLVLVNVPNQQTNPPLRGDWKSISETVQPGFKKAGIDAVAYYHIADIFSGPEVVAAFAEQFEERQLSNVIFINQKGNDYEIIITDITDKDNLIKPGQGAWKVTGNDLTNMTHKIYLKAASSGLDRTNLLIIEVPIYGEMAEAITGRRGEYFDVNFSSEKLAVPAFADTAQINTVMAGYPYEYEIVNPNESEKDLRNDGYQYVLYYVHTIGRNVKKILEYETSPSETAYISEVSSGDGSPKVKSINANTPVYKFYIKHIYSDNVFLGTKWDADTTWQDALNNYNLNLRNQLIRD